MLTATDLQEMASHWLRCPPNGYLGSAYGAPVEDLLHTPLSSGLADDLIAKLRTDVPIMGDLPPDQVNIYARPMPPDRMALVLEVAGSFVALDESQRQQVGAEV